MPIPFCTCTPVMGDPSSGERSSSEEISSLLHLPDSGPTQDQLRTNSGPTHPGPCERQASALFLTLGIPGEQCSRRYPSEVMQLAPDRGIVDFGRKRRAT